MSKNNIRLYIREQLEKKVSKDTIAQNLKKAGWNDVDIDIAYSKALKSKEEEDVKDNSGDGYAIASFTLGICSVFFAVYPPIAIVGLVLGILSIKKTSHHSKAVWGIVLSTLGLLIGILFWIMFAFFTFNYGGFDHGRYFGHSSYLNSYSDSSFDENVDEGI